jgi:putative FmdB family regulatory protein
MPLYEYSCRKCSKRFEALLFGKEKPACPKCSSTDLVKLVSTFAAHGGGKSSDSFGSDFGGGGDFGGDSGGDFGGDSGDADGGDFSAGSGGCGSCGDPRGPGSCAIN